MKTTLTLLKISSLREYKFYWIEHAESSTLGQEMRKKIKTPKETFPPYHSVDITCLNRQELFKRDREKNTEKTKDSTCCCSACKIPALLPPISSHGKLVSVDSEGRCRSVRHFCEISRQHV